MNRQRLLKGFALTALVGACAIGVQPALADDDDCNVPLAEWKPVKAIDTLAKSQGWSVSKIRTDDGCYEIRGVDRDGRRFKAKVDPATLTIIRIKTDDGSGRARGDRDDDRAKATDPARPSGQVPAGGIVKPGSKPQVQIQ
ncbi:hypothetical protein LMG7141_01411 [Ralstonia condita]|jgi:hypothetical protein|uniref:PepSY domain-containing protein n=1 Tax=Ralstonia condita TaxID=3058600 RepID=A0ABM9J5S1_9RALS|nr:PepSY domain-containing protein [Ralstonia sp. LMG 7141]MDE2203153.1 PepSY domain-containing protein [Burkholderiaceae bacterium]CAJ0783613.1 hypothetical protein LMG7141_01411 [Ralstonia sp. LMG 7141]